MRAAWAFYLAPGGSHVLYVLGSQANSSTPLICHDTTPPFTLPLLSLRLAPFQTLYSNQTDEKEGEGRLTRGPFLCRKPLARRGEQHAAALEANLTSLESKLDALLASVEGAAGPPGRAVDEGVGKGDREGRQQDADAKDGKDRSG